MKTFNLHKTHFFVGQSAYNTGVGGSGPSTESTLPDHRWLKSSDFENIAFCAIDFKKCLFGRIYP